jgi:hypothetical protein
VFHVSELGGTVHNHVHEITGIRDDGVIQNTTFLVGDQAETTVSVRQSGNVADDDPFQKRDAILAVPTNLSEEEEEEKKKKRRSKCPGNQ